MSTKKEFGDFQTPDALAAKAIALVSEIFGVPDLVVEPTAGLGAFLKAAVGRWGSSARYEGYEINHEYVRRAAQSLAGLGVTLHHRDFFSEDWTQNLGNSGLERILVIGNPPWVTNSELGQLGSRNLPKKTNFQRLRGFDARTGKSNFDIAEWMLIRLIESLPPEGAVAMLCKTMTARKVLRHFWKTDGGRAGSRLFRIDAKADFDVAVDACLFMTTGRIVADRTATVYADLDLNSALTVFGFVDGALVSDMELYRRHQALDGGTSAYTWRSGIKHDAAKIMEFTRQGGGLLNGLGEAVELEDEFIYPLLKSSDLGNGRVETRKYVLVTQLHTGQDTELIRSSAPRTWDYLTRHEDALNGRSSSVYRNRHKFSIFGIGPYSFAPWKVAISGLYKSLRFVVVPPVNGRPVMVDDTCYSIPCHSEGEARLLYELLSSQPAREFLSSLVFMDSKRPITVDVLRRLSLIEAARQLGRLHELDRYIRTAPVETGRERQLSLLMEAQQEYRTPRLTGEPAKSSLVRGHSPEAPDLVT